MTARKPKKPVPHINELPPMGADFYFDLLPKLGKQDEQMREAMEILKHPWAKLVLDPETDRHQAQIALANLIKNAYRRGVENVRRGAGGGKRYPTDTGMKKDKKEDKKEDTRKDTREDTKKDIQSNGKRMPFFFKPSDEQLWLDKDAELKKKGEARYSAAWRRAARIAQDLGYLRKLEVEPPISDPEIANIWPVSRIRKHIAKHGK